MLRVNMLRILAGRLPPMSRLRVSTLAPHYRSLAGNANDAPSTPPSEPSTVDEKAKPEPSPDPVRFRTVLLGGALCYFATGTALGAITYMGMPDVPGVDTVVPLCTTAMFNRRVGWASRSPVYGKHIRDVGGIVLVIGQVTFVYVVMFAVGVAIIASDGEDVRQLKNLYKVTGVVTGVAEVVELGEITPDALLPELPEELSEEGRIQIAESLKLKPPYEQYTTADLKREWDRLKEDLRK